VAKERTADASILLLSRLHQLKRISVGGHNIGLTRGYVRNGSRSSSRHSEHHNVFVSIANSKKLTVAGPDMEATCSLSCPVGSLSCCQANAYSDESPKFNDFDWIHVVANFKRELPGAAGVSFALSVIFSSSS
jgi:hypothetical protein